MARHGKAEAAPPRLLALENSGPTASVALVCPGLCLAEISLAVGDTLSRRLLPGIRQLMEDTATNWEEIDAIAVSAGPGSFTGLRLGLATAKALVMATGKPLIAVSSVTVLARQLPWTERLLCPVIDARRGEVYTAFYRCDALGVPRRIGPVAVRRPEELAGMIEGEVLFVGDGIRLYRELWQTGLGGRASFADPGLFFPRASALGQAALEKWRAGEFLDPVLGTPEYIRGPELGATVAGPPS